MEALTLAPRRIEPLGDGALRIVLGTVLSEAIHRRVCALAARIAEAAAGGMLDEVVDVVPAFAVVAVHYRAEAVPVDGCESPFDALSRRLAPWLVEPEKAEAVAETRLVEIPVCYDGEFGPDLAAVAAHAGLTVDEAVAAHQRPVEPQRVYLLGFAPGNPYIGRLDAGFAVPRRATPRASLPLGSVCVANRQTVVYPIAAPGGWNVVGRTPLRLFDPYRAEPCSLRPGDRVRFRAIDAAEFARLDVAR